jgi:hypothetical protein
MDAHLPILVWLALVGASCGASPCVAPDEPSASVEQCPAPRYALTLSGDHPTIETLDGAPPLEHDSLALVLEHDLDGDGIKDKIVSLGLCGNWGECVHVILRGCGADVFSLASEPDHYAVGFTVEHDGEGPPVLWETTRGGVAGDDEVGRVRWELRGGRALPTDDYERLDPTPSSADDGADLSEAPAQDLCTPTVVEAIVFVIESRVHLNVSGSGFCQRAVPLLARVGDQLVTRIVLSSDGRSFAGMLGQLPNAGDHLHVGFADEELHDTGIAVHVATEAHKK